MRISSVLRSLPRVALALTSTAACDDDRSKLDLSKIECWTGGATASAGEGEVQTGIAEPSFVPMEDEQQVTLHTGPQGLSHIFVSARVRDIISGVEAENDTLPYVHFTAYLEDGTPAGALECGTRLPFPVETGDWSELANARLLVFNEEGISRAFDGPVQVRTEVLDCEGNYAIDEHWVQVVPP